MSVKVKTDYTVDVNSYFDIFVEKLCVTVLKRITHCFERDRPVLRTAICRHVLYRAQVPELRDYR